MNREDISFVDIDIFRGMIGCIFEKYKCDPFVFSPNVYGIVGFYIGADAFKLTSLHKTVNRFFAEEDVAAFQFEKTDDKNLVTMMDGGQMIETPVKDVICAIDLVKDYETVSHNGDERTFVSTKGIIFHLKGGNEVSFEIKTWFSEFITIQKGYNLIEKFASTEDFLDEWEDSEGYEAKVRREAIKIQ